MKHAGGGFEQSYNAHTAVDAERQIIIAAELTNNASDSDRVPGLIKAVERNLDEVPAQTLADAGFRSETTLAKVATEPYAVIVALGVDVRPKLTRFGV